MATRVKRPAAQTGRAARPAGKTAKAVLAEPKPAPQQAGSALGESDGPATARARTTAKASPRAAAGTAEAAARRVDTEAQPAGKGTRATRKPSVDAKAGVKPATGAASPNTSASPAVLVPVGADGAEVLASATQPARPGARPERRQLGPLDVALARPDYWDKACADLVKRDRIMKKLIPRFGQVHLVSRGEPFVTLARSVVGQQISVKAAEAVWQRVLAACPDCAPQRVVALGQERLAACGLSKRKAEYILDLSRHFVDGSVSAQAWSGMDDEAVIADLTQIRGIGRWTAEMFLIFNLLRPDVLPLDDVGLLRAISVNYFSGEPVTRSEAREVAANWQPWRTVATWYLWRSLDPVPVAY